jgi:type IV pilus assembly protein PilQ
MTRYLYHIGLTLLVVLLFAPSLLAQETTHTRINRSAFPERAHQTIETLNVRGAQLSDLLRGIASQYELNLIVDESVNDVVTLRLADIPVIDAVLFLADEYHLDLEQRGSILRISKPQPEPPPAAPLQIHFRNGLLTLDVQDVPIDELARVMADSSGYNLIVRQGVRGSVTGRLNQVGLVEGLRLLLANNGFTLRERDGVFIIDGAGQVATEGAGRAGSFFVNVQYERIDLDVTDARVTDVVAEIASQLDLRVVSYATSDNTIRARASGLTVEEALTLLFRGTALTYRRQGDVYVIADRQTDNISTSRLIRLKHARAAGLVELIPQDLRQRASVQLIKEQNGIMVQATSDVVAEIEQFVAELDRRSPQILIEALVVDFEDLDQFELGFRMGLRDTLSTAGRWEFGAGGTYDRGFSASARGPRLNRELQPVRDILGMRTIGRLPADFYVQIQALERAGKAKVLSRPQVATLNGHAASISVGTTRYYILRTASPVVPGGQYFPIESERFEKVEAHVRLEVVPWVTDSGDVNAEIRPEFSTPVGSLDSRTPPTINTRQLETTVRLRDGETIILGGLIQEARTTEQTMVPILGRIPIIGHLFRGRKTVRRKSELVIYITPHVFYGDERDEQKWYDMRDRLELSDPTLGPRMGHTQLK